MSINYIKENIKKFDPDNLISFLFDIVIRGGLDNVEDYDSNKEYIENEKVYIKDEKGNHHIYKCMVPVSTRGAFVQDEWLDLLHSFRKPVVTEETLIAAVDVREEVVIADQDGQLEFALETSGAESGDYDIVVFHPEYGRLARSDFNVAENIIILNEEYAVNNGERIIVDLYRNI